MIRFTVIPKKVVLQNWCFGQFYMRCKVESIERIFLQKFWVWCGLHLFKLITWFISCWEENNWRLKKIENVHSKWQLLTTLSKNHCYYVNLVRFDISYFLLSFRWIKWGKSQLPTAWTDVNNLELLDFFWLNIPCSCYKFNICLLSSQNPNLKRFFFYYDKSWNGKRYPFANVKTFCHIRWQIQSNQKLVIYGTAGA